MDILQLIKEQICDVCHKMWQLGWVAANDGNVSVKLPDGNFLAVAIKSLLLMVDIKGKVWYNIGVVKPLILSFYGVVL